MTNNEMALELFRLNYRVQVLQRLVLRLAFSRLSSHQGLQASDSRQRLAEILKQESALTDKLAGMKFRGDPGMTGLYAEETRDIIGNMVDMLMSLPDPYLDVLEAP